MWDFKRKGKKCVYIKKKVYAICYLKVITISNDLKDTSSVNKKKKTWILLYYMLDMCNSVSLV